MLFDLPTGQNGVGLSFAKILANPGLANQINSYSDAWEAPILKSNQATMTFDQRLTDSISMFSDAWLSVRPTYNHNSPGGNSFTISVPRSNPYFPTGAPANLTSLNVYEDLENQVPIQVHTTETAGRFDAGFNLTLPYDWTGKLYGAVSKISNYTLTQGTINSNALSAAVGNTVNAVAAVNGTVNPGTPAYSRPGNVPYFNPFCDLDVIFQLQRSNHAGLYLRLQQTVGRRGSKRVWRQFRRSAVQAAGGYAQRRCGRQLYQRHLPEQHHGDQLRQHGHLHLRHDVGPAQ